MAFSKFMGHLSAFFSDLHRFTRALESVPTMLSALDVKLSQQMKEGFAQMADVTTTLNLRADQLATLDGQILAALKAASERITAREKVLTDSQTAMTDTLKSVQAELASVKATVQAAPVDTSGVEKALDTHIGNMTDFLAKINALDADTSANTSTDTSTKVPTITPGETQAADSKPTQDAIAAGNASSTTNSTASNDTSTAAAGSTPSSDTPATNAAPATQPGASAESNTGSSTSSEGVAQPD